MNITELTPAHVIKLASLAVHAEEYLDNVRSIERQKREDAEFDYQAIRGLLADPQVREVLDDPNNAVFLPVKR
jgi:hypothetical protein